MMLMNDGACGQLSPGAQRVPVPEPKSSVTLIRVSTVCDPARKGERAHKIFLNVFSCYTDQLSKGFLVQAPGRAGVILAKEGKVICM